jgi:hypothetical protein
MTIIRTHVCDRCGKQKDITYSDADTSKVNIHWTDMDEGLTRQQYKNFTLCNECSQSVIKFIGTKPKMLHIPEELRHIDPVYVGHDSHALAHESIFYCAREMTDKLYEVQFKGEKWALKKHDGHIEFLKWSPNDSCWVIFKEYKSIFKQVF